MAKVPETAGQAKRWPSGPSAPRWPSIGNEPEPSDAERLERIERNIDCILGVFCEVVKIAPKRKPPKPRTPIVGF